MVDPHVVTMKHWAGCFVVFDLLAVVLTVFRLVYRRRTRQLWWDDYFALVALCFVLPIYGTTWALLTAKDWTVKMQVTTTWILNVVFLPVLWTSRISLALSIARIMPPQNIMFRVALIFAGLMGALGIATTFQLIYWCAKENSWELHPPYVCFLSASWGWFPYGVDIICVVLIVLLPLNLFWTVKLQRAARLLVLAGFGVTALIAPLSFTSGLLALLPGYGQTPKGGISRWIVMQWNSIMFMIVCNFLVVITYFYQRKYNHDESFVTELAAISRTPPERHPTSTIPISDENQPTSPHLRTTAASRSRPEPLPLTDVSMQWSDVDSRLDSRDLKSYRSDFTGTDTGTDLDTKISTTL